MRQVLDAASWWHQNRPDEPDSIDENLERVLELIAAHPGIGRIARNVKLPNVRRLRVGRSPYHIYFHLRQKPFLHVEVVGFRHRRRGSPPPL